MKLYICGNGFDRNHGMKTSYKDYKKYLNSNNYELIVSDFEKFKYHGTVSCEALWSDVEESLSFSWEEYLKRYASVYSVGNRVEPTDEEYNDKIKQILNRTSEFRESSNFVRNMDRFVGVCFYEWIKSIRLPEKKRFDLDNNSLYITFNYTETLEKVYGINKNNILHIHGSIGNLSDSEIYEKYTVNGSVITYITPHFLSELQFGSIDNDPNSVSPDFVEKIKNNVNEASKPGVEDVERLLSLTGKSIKTNYPKLKEFLNNQPIDEVVIMGHSVNRMDTGYYKDILIPNYKDKPWKIYIYNMSENDKYRQLFVNENHLDVTFVKYST